MIHSGIRRNKWKAWMCLAGLVWSGLGWWPSAVLAQQRPNVLLLMLESELDPEVFDALSAESVGFGQFVAYASGAQNWAGLLTGKNPGSLGVVETSGRMGVLPTTEITLAEVFEREGYTTALMGTWKNGNQYPNDPVGQGFSHFIGFRGAFAGPIWGAILERDGVPFEASGHVYTEITQAAHDFIRHAGSTPFFCMVGYPALDPEDWTTAPFSADQKGHTGAMAADRAVLDVLRLLDSLQIREHTIVLVYGHSKPNTTQAIPTAGLLACESQVLVHWKNFLPRRQLPHPVTPMDLFPTLLGLCQISPPEGLLLDGWYLNAIMQGAPDRTAGRPITFPNPTPDSTDLPAALPVGFPSALETYLPVGDYSRKVGRIEIDAHARWSVGFTEPGDSLIWDLEIQTSGWYAIDLEYVLLDRNASVVLQVTAGETQRACPRATQEATQVPHTWERQKAGVFYLPKGKHPLVVSTRCKNDRVYLKAIRLTLKTTP